MRYKTQSDLPVRLDELGTDWLTAAFTESGILRDAKVSRAEVDRIGEGEGFIGVIARLELAYDGNADGAPTTTIVKIPTDVPENRMMGELMGVYWREIHFYEELAPELPVRTPALHYAALTEDPMRTRQYKFVAVMDLLPGFIVDKMMVYAKQSMKESSQRYTLMLEDLAPARVGDQVNGGTPEVCAEVLDAVAKMHASQWGSPTLDRCGWLNDLTVNPRIRHRMYLEARSKFLERHAKLLSSGGEAYVRWNDQHGGVLGRRIHREAPPTVIHGDLRLDNVFFDDSRPDDRRDPRRLADGRSRLRGVRRRLLPQRDARRRRISAGRDGSPARLPRSVVSRGRVGLRVRALRARLSPRADEHPADPRDHRHDEPR